MPTLKDHHDDADASRTGSIRVKADGLSKWFLLLRGISMVKSIKGGS
ncbi:MAG: hypothetical protein FGF50_10435 [Candidatus Brockarchaeota archaeon]|nr:hypothetical protein [Candidatus Brockarchaeota archaeon]